jgi:hypothetical protein
MIAKAAAGNCPGCGKLLSDLDYRPGLGAYLCPRCGQTHEKLLDADRPAKEKMK